MMPIRRIVIDYYTGMGVFWSSQPAKLEHRTNIALNRFLHLMPDCVGMPQLISRPPILNSRKVRYLPFRFESIDEVHDVLLYGDYGGIGRIIRWNAVGAKLDHESHENFLPPTDVNNLTVVENSIIFGTSLPQLYRRRQRGTI